MRPWLGAVLELQGAVIPCWSSGAGAGGVSGLTSADLLQPHHGARKGRE